MKMSTILNVNEKSLESNEIKNKQMMHVSHVESRTFLEENNGTIK